MVLKNRRKEKAREQAGAPSTWQELARHTLMQSWRILLWLLVSYLSFRFSIQSSSYIPFPDYEEIDSWWNCPWRASCRESDDHLWWWALHQAGLCAIGVHFNSPHSTNPNVKRIFERVCLHPSRPNIHPNRFHPHPLPIFEGLNGNGTWTPSTLNLLQNGWPLTAACWIDNVKIVCHINEYAQGYVQHVGTWWSHTSLFMVFSVTYYLRLCDAITSYSWVQVLLTKVE